MTAYTYLETMNGIEWKRISPEGRASILASVMPRARARLRHKVMYGEWNDLGVSVRDKLYRVDWKKCIIKATVGMKAGTK